MMTSLRTAPGPDRAKRVRWYLIAACLSVGAVAALTQCSSQPPVRTAVPPTAEKPAGSPTFALSAAEMAALEKQSSQGSGAAAYRLSLYYETVQHDPKEAMRWMKTSAEYGDVGGMHSYAQYLKASDDPKDKAQARAWLQKVIAQGDDFTKAVAQRDLRELDSAQRSER